MPPHDVIPACMLVCNKIQSSSEVRIDVLHIPRARNATLSLCFYGLDNEAGDLTRHRRPRGIAKTHVVPLRFINISSCCCCSLTLLLTASCCFDPLWVRVSITTASSRGFLPQSWAARPTLWILSLLTRLRPRGETTSGPPLNGVKGAPESHILPTAITVTLRKNSSSCTDAEER